MANYNGYDFPELPQVEGYFYQTLCYTGREGQYRLFLSDAPFTVLRGPVNVGGVEFEADLLINTTGKNINYVMCSITTTEDEPTWAISSKISDHGYGVSYAASKSAAIIYANHALYNENGEPYIIPNSVTGISISAPDTVARGFFIAITVNVSGDGEYNKAANCTVSGANSSGTALGKQSDYTYRLYCDYGETAESLTVTAASVQDPSFTATKTIAVTGNTGGGGDGPDGPDNPDEPDEPDDPGGTTATPERLERAFWSGYAAATALRGFTSAVIKAPAGNGRSAARSATAAAQLMTAFWKGFAAGCAV